MALGINRILYMLHHGHKLHVTASDRFQEGINLGSPALRRLVDGAHSIELYSGLP